MQQIKTTANSFFPIFINTEQLPILIIGGGELALNELQNILLINPEARITLVAANILPSILLQIPKYKNLNVENRALKFEDFNNHYFVIATTNDNESNFCIKNMARQKKFICKNAIGRYPECQFSSTVNLTNNTVALINENPYTNSAEVELVNLRAAPIINKKPSFFNSLLNQNLFEDSTEADKRRKRIAKYLVTAFCLMLFGHFIFSQIHISKISSAVVNWGKTLDTSLLLIVLTGIVAQIVDGALGMGYGVTSATILSAVGVTSPAAISASIHTAEIVASGASGYSHFKFGNVNKKLFKALVIPGVIGAVLGAFVLVFVGDKYGQYMRPFIALYTLFLGFKFIWNAFNETKPQQKFKHYSLLAWVGGFFDSIGGGGWGPIVTSTLINNGRSHKYVIGSVSLTEFFVTLSSAFSFFLFMGLTHWKTIACLMLGSLLAAPFAAKLAGRIPKKAAYILLGILVIVWSGKILYKYL